jgi:hypothetical protein
MGWPAAYHIVGPGRPKWTSSWNGGAEMRLKRQVGIRSWSQLNGLTTHQLIWSRLTGSNLLRCSLHLSDVDSRSGNGALAHARSHPRPANGSKGLQEADECSTVTQRQIHAELMSPDSSWDFQFEARRNVVISQAPRVQPVLDRSTPTAVPEHAPLHTAFV